MYIARQAIFDRSLKVYGYELLFRQSSKSIQYDGISAIHASASILGGLFEAGISSIVDDARAFINFDAEFIHSDGLELIDKSRLVIELLEDIQIDEVLMERLKFLKKKGYKIALDDFVESYTTYPLIPFADIIKFDLIATPLDSISKDVKKALSNKKIILAENVETQEEFLKAKSMGFHLYQGYFFSKPQIIGKSASHTTTKSQYSRVITELQKKEPSYQVLAEIIEMDANLAYRFVRLISIRKGDNMIYSIKKALMYMGLKELERWINVLMLRELSFSKPDELIRISLVRTKFAELIAIHSNLKISKYEASMMGLFSTIDAIINQTMSEALKDIMLPKTITDALINKNGELYPVYLLMLSYEQGDWSRTEEYAGLLRIDEIVLYDDYVEAVKWTRGIMELMYKD